MNEIEKAFTKTYKELTTGLSQNDGRELLGQELKEELTCLIELVEEKQVGNCAKSLADILDGNYKGLQSTERVTQQLTNDSDN